MARFGSYASPDLRGFTLVECMMALAILILLMPVCFSFTRESNKRAEGLWDELTAQEWANSLLERACAAPPLKDHEEVRVTWPEREPEGLYAIVRASNELHLTSNSRSVAMQRLSIEVICPQSDGRPPMRLTFERLRCLPMPTENPGVTP